EVVVRPLPSARATQPVADGSTTPSRPDLPPSGGAEEPSAPTGATASGVTLRSDVRWRHAGEVLHLDVAVVSPSAPAAVRRGSARQECIAAQFAEEAKHRL